MRKNHIFVGMDVHKNDNVIAIAESGRDKEVRPYGKISNDLHALEKLVRKLKKAHPTSILHFAYEAGPCGNVIYRRLQQLKIDCCIIAPSKIPKQAGDKVKTDRRDANMLARLHRSGELTPINVPDPEDEAIRDLCRFRTDVKKDLQRQRNRLKGFLLRNGYKYTGKSSWTLSHMKYLRELMLPNPIHNLLLEEIITAIDNLQDKLERVDEHIESIAPKWKHYPVVKALMALKGFKLLTSTVITAELGDIARFEKPTQLMSFLGLVPSEYSSGGSRRQGTITKTGNSHARFFLVESAKHYSRPPRISQNLSHRQEHIATSIREISMKAQIRLHKKYWALVQRGVNVNKASVAVARELVGFIWKICTEVSNNPKLILK